MYIKYPCTACGGKGSTLQRRTARVQVPAGVEDGQTMRVQVGQRELFICFRVSGSEVFRREGADVHSDVELSLATAVLGGSVRVPGIHEESMLLRIPSGTSSHTRIRLQGKGVKRVNSFGQGDHYVHLKIRVPRYESAHALNHSDTDTDMLTGS